MATALRKPVAEQPPDLHRAMVELEGTLWLEPRLRELVSARTAQLNGASGNLLRHARQAIGLGETPSRLTALAGWRDSQLFTEDERAALALAEALVLAPVAGTVAAAHRDAAEHFGPDELDQLAFACAIENAWDRLELAAGMIA
jgi:AhpD family alkylhydroperoxidase